MRSFLIRDILSDAQAAAAAANNMASANAALAAAAAAAAAVAAQHQHHHNQQQRHHQNSPTTTAAATAAPPTTTTTSHHHHHQLSGNYAEQISNGATPPAATTNSCVGSNQASTSNHSPTSTQQQVPPNFQLNSPLDALFQMTSSTFDALKRGEKRKEQTANTKQNTKKKRKSRTAFTNNQIYELERRFRLQKYLSPSDRDEIAMSLNLTNAQVITWFQNRRAKMKRDLEEQRRDIETASLLNLQKIFLESFQALSQMDTTAIKAPECEAEEEIDIETTDCSAQT